MRATEFVKVIQDMIERRGDRQFTVQIPVNGEPVAEVPRMNLVCRVDPRGIGPGSMGPNLHLDVPKGI